MPFHPGTTLGPYAVIHVGPIPDMGDMRASWVQNSRSRR